MTVDANDSDLGAQLRTAVGHLYRRFRVERPNGALGDAALDVLKWLNKAGPQTLTQLSERGRVAPASMSQSVNRLTSHGYATRSIDPDDRRRVLFSLTASGAELARVGRGQQNAWLDARLNVLSAKERAVLADACAILADIAES